MDTYLYLFSRRTPPGRPRLPVLSPLQNSNAGEGQVSDQMSQISAVFPRSHPRWQTRRSGARKSSLAPDERLALPCPGPAVAEGLPCVGRGLPAQLGMPAPPGAEICGSEAQMGPKGTVSSKARLPGQRWIWLGARNLPLHARIGAPSLQRLPRASQVLLL